MIKLIKKINATYFKTYNDFLFVLEKDNSPLFIYDLNSFELIKKVGGNYGGGLYIVEKYVIDESFKGVNINTLLEKIFFEEENIYYYIKNNKYAVIRKFIEEFEVEFYLLEIEKNKILKKINFEGEIALLTELGVVISYTNDTLYKYSDFSLLWQKDFERNNPIYRMGQQRGKRRNTRSVFVQRYSYCSYPSFCFTDKYTNGGNYLFTKASCRGNDAFY